MANGKSNCGVEYGSDGGAGSIFERPVLRSHHPETYDAGLEMAGWLEGSEYLHGARREGRLAQAPYCLRCAPQVHGAILRELRIGHDALQAEMNALCDNPLVFPEEEEVYSCGNFHALYPARICDGLGSALTTLASISERRINMAMDGKLSGLPTFLVADGGLNSGLMMVQTTAAALVCEARALSTPASADSIPTNCDREDHVSMGPVAGLKVLQIAELTRSVLAIELMVACQAMELRSGVATPSRLAHVHRLVRGKVPFIRRDEILAPLLAECETMIESGVLFDEPQDSRAVFIRAPRGAEKVCKTWAAEAAYRMIQNNLDPEVAECPSELIVYGGIGKAARDWNCFYAILEALKDLAKKRRCSFKAASRSYP